MRALDVLQTAETFRRRRGKPAKPANEWPDERVEELRRLLGEGHSAAAIGAMMRVSRNAVIGQAHRRGIEFKNPSKNQNSNRPRLPTAIREKIAKTPKSRPGKETPEERARRLRAGPIAPPPLPEPDPYHGGGVSLFEARRGQCRFPLNHHDPIREFRFCGARTVYGSWCGPHAVKVFGR